MRIRSLLLCLTLAWAAACGTPRSAPVAMRIVATPVPTPTAVPTPEPTTVVTAAPTARPSRVPAVRRAADAAPTPVAGLDAFRGLGTWMDVFDYSDDPSSIVPDLAQMAARGVRTLYLETSRYDRPGHIEYPRAAGAAIEEAHRLGMRVVAWYPPAFVSLDFEVERSVAAIGFRSPSGQRFDGFGADIERRDVTDAQERTSRLLEYSRRLRAASDGLVLAAITYPPSSFDRNANLWPGFPWGRLAGLYDVFMPMSYWTYRSTDPAFSASQTSSDLARTRLYTGRPVHIIGGEGAKADPPQVAAYVRAAAQGGSLGGGLYDYRTTQAAVWGELGALNG